MPDSNYVSNIMDIAYYADDPSYPGVTKELTDKITHMQQQADAEDLYIINPVKLRAGTYNLTDAYDRYMSQTKPFRRKSDWLTLSAIGLTNQQIFDYIYNKAMHQDDSLELSTFGHYEEYQNIDESASVDVPDYVPVMDKPVDIDALHAQYSGPEWNQRIYNLSDWEAETGYIAINPGRIITLGALEELWSAWNNMIRRHQRYSDWKMIELFGLTNQQMYIGYKQWLLKKEKESGEPLTPPGVIADVIAPRLETSITKTYFNTILENGDITHQEMASLDAIPARHPEFFDNRVYTTLINDIRTKDAEMNGNVPSAEWFHSDLPAYTPDEMIDMGVYQGGSNPEDTSDLIPGQIMNEDWFREYCQFFETGYETDHYIKLNQDRIHKLEQLYYIPSDRTGSKDWQESVRALGWNPDIEFTPKNRVVNDRLMSAHYESVINHYDFEDVRDEMTLFEAKKEKSNAYKPIFITLIEGGSPLSIAIKKATKASYTHAMLSLDSTMEKMYSFGLDTKVKLTGSFIIDDIRTKPKDKLFKAYAILVDNETFNQIKSNIDHFIQRQRQTKYSWDGLIKYLFKQPSEGDDEKMFCSQFVDRMLKLGSIDFTKKNSSLLSPNDLDKAAKKNKKIYTVFKGKVGGYKKEVIDKIINTLLQRETYFKPIKEARELPIQMNKNGDVLININKTDYAAEYQASHRLLMEYDKTNNIDGMKAELAKLWAMLLSIEEKIYGDHMISSAKRSKLYITRAHILGDFNKYMEIVNRNDGSFNFNDYFQKSPYAKGVYKVNAATISGLLSLVKQVL